jgi:Cyclic nucleotide-binding domain
MAAGTESHRRLLGRIPVFEELSPEDPRGGGGGGPRSFEPHKVVFREGDDSDSLYVVRNEHARATREHRCGRVLTLAMCEPGDIIGELKTITTRLRNTQRHRRRRDAMDAGRAPRLAPLRLARADLDL